MTENKIKRIVVLYFSPTSNSKTIALSIAQGIKADALLEINFTKPYDARRFKAIEGDVVILATPSYNGRVPHIVTERLEEIKGCGGPLICVVTFGNRAYGNTLAELNYIMKNKNFVTIAAGAFVGHHSFSNEKHPIAEGRPNKTDLQDAETFGTQCYNKLMNVRRDENCFPNNEQIRTLRIDDKIPGKTSLTPAPRIMFSKSKPTKACVQCGRCIEVCPTNAIGEDFLYLYIRPLFVR